MLCRVVGYIIPTFRRNVLPTSSGSSSLRETLHTEHGHNRPLRNIGKNLLKEERNYLRRPQCPAAPLWEPQFRKHSYVESSWNVMSRGDAREGKWRENWRMEWVTSTLHTTPEHGVSSITTADAHTSAASSRLNWRPRRFKWIRPFRPKTKSGFCACAITFQTQSNTLAPADETRYKRQAG